MRRIAWIAAAVFLLSPGCVNKVYDLDKADNDVTFLPNLTIPVEETLSRISSRELLGIGAMDTDENGCYEMRRTSNTVSASLSESDLDAVDAFSVDGDIIIPVDGMPEFLKDSRNEVKFNGAALTVNVTNPFSTPVTMECLAGSKSISSGPLYQGHNVVEVNVDELMDRVPDRIIISGIRIRKAGGVKSAPDFSPAPLTASGTFKFSASSGIPLKFKSGTRLEFDYSFENIQDRFNVRETLDGFDARSFDINGTVSCTVPLSLSATCIGDIDAAITPIRGSRDGIRDQAFSISVRSENRISTACDVSFHFSALAEADMELSDRQEIDIRISSLKLVDGLDITDRNGRL